MVATDDGARRVLKVRKTGEFGRRIAPSLSQLYEPPKRVSSLDPFLQTSETRNSVSSVNGIRKPSQKLELPSFDLDLQSDSVPAETGESLQGYAYPDPDSEGAAGGYDFNPMKVKHPAVAEYPEPDPEERQRIEEPPANVVPQVEAEFVLPPKAFGAETEEHIDSERQQRPENSSPKPVSTRPSAELSSQSQQSQDGQACGEHDHECWPHGYQGEIPGEAGTDYPILREIVDTPFDCDNVQYSGYYADVDDAARCQIFHICLKGNAYRKTQKWSFLCPNGTVFSQENFVCVWWHSAPECNTGLVDELSLRNAELGWDNLTDTESRSVGGNFDVKSAMNSLRNGNLQASGSSDSKPNIVAVPTTRRPPSSRNNAIPYRVPVKVNARTQLKEVAGNGLQDEGNKARGGEAEYTGEETEAYETSLSHQSEARTRSKTASELHKSGSEAYEQKSVSDSVAPFVVNRTPGDYSSPVTSSQDPLQVVQQGEFADEEGVPQVVMMSSQQKNPDGSEGYAEVPVMGYRYPVPTSPPGSYLPPRSEFVARTTTTTELPNTTTFLPVTEDYVEETAGQEGYNYPTPDKSAAFVEPTTEGGYNYPAPSPTTQQPDDGYNYVAPTTTKDPVAFQETEASQTPEIEDGGYAAYEQTSTFTPDTTTTSTIPTTTTPTSSQNLEATAAAYLPPPTTTEERGGYDLGPTRSSASATILSKDANLRQLPTTTDTTVGDEQLASKLSVTTNPESEDYTHAGLDLSTLTGENSVSESESEPGGYSDKSTMSYTTPTASGPTTGDALDTQDEKVNKILQEIQSGGAEVRDENGKTLNFEELKKLILSTPNGLLSLQKADDDSVTPTDSSLSSSTEASTTTLGQREEQDVQNEEQETELVAAPKGLEEVQGIEDTPAPPPSALYLPVQPTAQLQSLPQQSYFSNDRLVSIKRPGFEISAPSKEYESHLVQKNTLELNSNPNPFSGFTSFQPETRQSHQNVVNYATPTRSPFDQHYATLQNTKAPQLYYQQSEQQPQQQQFRVQQSQQAPPSEVDFLRSSDPQSQQQQYYQTQPQTTQQLNSNAENFYFPQPQTRSQASPPQPQSSQFRFPDEPRTQAPHHQQQQQKQQYFQPNPTSEYLPPPPSTPAQFYSPAPTQYRNEVPSTRDLTNNIQLQQSFSYPLPQPSSITNTRNLPSPLDIKIVPALLVNTHTRVEQPNNNYNNNQQRKVEGGRHYDNNFRQFSQQQQQQQQIRNVNNNANQYLQYSSQSENRPVKVQAPRLNPFTVDDALPKHERFTMQESRAAKQVMEYPSPSLHGRLVQRGPTTTRPTQHPPTTSRQLTTSPSLRHFGGVGGRGYLGQLSEQNSLSNFYPGRDNSLGVKLTYN
ncbi:hypothetical protein Fcan01_08481 [Folsomia candida]|uniref:Chitin-binding type-2 domain-containing protein n=1 Tax=Folsomia candida TaxID=158441 RepID=A0A226ELK7_FOLCA|nr:hypothetical protein Fcan01_08481 [Folsomia candida]